MKSLGPAADVAIPHEAGHVVVGRAVGLHATGVEVEVERFFNPDGISIGNFATLAYEPTDEAIPGMDPELRAAYVLFIAGGVAGARFSGITTIDSGADPDRKELARLTTKSLEEVSDLAIGIIKPRRRAFRQLVSLMRQRYMDLVKNRDIQTGHYTLLTEDDLDKLFSQYASVQTEQERT